MMKILIYLKIRNFIKVSDSLNRKFKILIAIILINFLNLGNERCKQFDKNDLNSKIDKDKQ